MKTPTAVLSSSRRVVLFSVLFSLLLLISRPLAASEFRGLWVDAFGSGFLTASEVSKLVSDCRTYNFNAIVVQMRRRGDAFYVPHAPNGDPKTTVIASNYDALQELINQCHNSTPRIEVHCWVCANLIWSDTSKAPTQAEHVYNLHPEYLTKSSGGNAQFSEGYYLDPGNPDAMQWNYNMARDVVSHYDIDGFHWDYIRYPQQDAGYNDTAISRYNTEFGLTGIPSASGSQFSTWRRRQVTDFVRWANADLLEIKPSLVISAAVFANRTDAKTSRFQDWAAWNSEGIIDVCMPMNYSADNTLFASQLNDAFANAGVRVIYDGLGAYLNTKDNTVAQLNLVRNKPGQGSVLFSYRTPNSGTVDQAGTLQYIKDNFQPDWTPTPALNWVANPTKGIVKGTIRRLDNAAAVYNASVTLTGASTVTQKTEPHGKYAFFEVTPGACTISASSAGFNSGATNINVTAGGIFNIDLSIDLPLTPDTTPPLISSARVSSITSNSCVVTWTTDEASDSIVEYGTSDFDTTAGSTNRALQHSVTLTGLTPGSIYGYHVKSSDAAGNQSVSPDAQFTTPPANADIVVDNIDATVVGVWSSGTSSTDKFATDYRFKGKGTGSSYLQFNPNFQVGGNYQVFEWHTAGSNRATNVPVVVTSYVGTQSYFVNQQTNGGKWNYVGTFYFPAGASGNVIINDGFADSTAGRVAVADAIRFSYLPDLQVNDIIIDNPAALVTGTWTTTTSSADKFGSDYRFKSRGTGTAFLTYAPNFVIAGDYQVYEWHPAGSNRTLNAPHVINSALSSQTVSVNQQINGGKWNLLGTFGFNQGSNGLVRITDGFATPTNGVVVADAVKFVYTPPPAPPSPPSALTATAISTTQVQLNWTASASGINFIVGRSLVSDGPYTDIAVLPANTTSYQDSNLTPGTTYFYVVRAVGAGGPSNNSTEASATTISLPPSSPTGLTATAVSSSRIDLSWNDGENPDSAYIVSRSSSANGPFSDMATLEVRFTSYSDTGLDATTTYYYQVRAHNTGGDSAPSNVASATTFAALPATPTGLIATAISANRIDLSWSDNATNEDSYAVLRSTGGADWVVVANLPANSVAYSDQTVGGHTAYAYTLRASNVAGSVFSDVVQVTTPNTVPVAQAGADQVLSADANCQATVTLNGSASYDADQDPLSYTWSGSFGDVSGSIATVNLPLGVHVITLTVTDGQGGRATALVNVTVADTTAPRLALNGSSPMSVECHTGYLEPGATAADSCAGDLSAGIQVAGAVDANTPGVYTLTYIVSDPSGNATSASRVVNVVDTTAPTLTLNGASSMSVECHGTYTEPGATASDSCAGDLTAAIQVAGVVDANTPGVYTLTYNVADPSGNGASATRTVTVADTTAPTLVLNGDSVITLEAGSTFTDPGAQATDACAGDLTPALSPAASIDTSVPGTNYLTYTVTDPSGNTATVTRTVTVVDTTAPVITDLKGSQGVITFVNHKMVPISVTASTSDNSDKVPNLRIITITSNEPVYGTGDGDTGPDWEITSALTCNLRAERAGNLQDRIYTITVQSTDDYGNSAYSSVTVTVPHDARPVSSR